MTPGRVVKIRLDTQACMGCVDLARLIKAAPEGVSFAQVVVVALNSALAALRGNGIIPDRQGFEYNQLMEPFKDQPHIDRARKLLLSKKILHNQNNIPAPVQAIPVEIQRKSIRYKELQARFDADELNMAPAEVEELRQLTIELNP